MGASGPQRAKRAFVKVLLTIAVSYSVRLELSRDSPDEACAKAFKKLSLKVHPDKGGLLAHAQELNNAKRTWDEARRKAPKPRERQSPGSGDIVATSRERPGKKKGLRVRSLGVLLTYNGVQDQAQWLSY